MEGRSGKRVGVARWRARENAASVSQREREKEDKQDTQTERTCCETCVLV